MTITTVFGYESASGQANATSFEPILLNNGAQVAFLSAATNLDSSQSSGRINLYIRDIATDSVRLVDFAPAGSPIRGAITLNNTSPTPLFDLSADGKTLVYATARADVVPDDTNGRTDIFVKDLETGTVTRFDGSLLPFPSITSLSISADGRKVAVATLAGRSGDVSVLDVATGTVTRADVTVAGQDIGLAFGADISADGTAVAFRSESELFVRDLETGTTTRFQAFEIGDFDIAAGGDHVVFSTIRNFAAADTNSSRDVYVLNVATGQVTLASAAADGTVGNSLSRGGSLSADGSSVVFTSLATNLVAGDTNAAEDVFVKNLATGAITRLTPTEGGQFNGATNAATISADGSRIAFASAATNVVDGDGNGVADVFVAGPARARVTTLTFDEIVLGEGGEQRLPNGYGGFDWVQTGVYNPDGSFGYLQSSGQNLAFIVEAADFDVAGYEDGTIGSPVTIVRDTPFDLVSANFTAAFRDGLTITARAFADAAGTQEIGTLTFVADRNALTAVDFAGADVDGTFAGARRIEFNANDGDIGTRDYFGFDDLVFRTWDSGLF